MPAYVIAQVNITDREKFREYQRGAAAAITDAGGRVLGAAPTAALHGELPSLHTIVIEFSDAEAAEKFYANDYQPLVPLREASTDWAAISVLPGLPPR